MSQKTRRHLHALSSEHKTSAALANKKFYARRSFLHRTFSASWRRASPAGAQLPSRSRDISPALNLADSWSVLGIVTCCRKNLLKTPRQVSRAYNTKFVLTGACVWLGAQRRGVVELCFARVRCIVFVAAKPCPEHAVTSCKG